MENRMNRTGRTLLFLCDGLADAVCVYLAMAAAGGADVDTGAGGAVSLMRSMREK